MIGGGANGLGIALDASSRGYKTLLLEQHDFGKATSSRSTKLAHGGVRYLRQRNFSLVKEALRERDLLFKNAPHLVWPQPFVIPVYGWWEQLYYAAGLKFYDFLAGGKSIGRSKRLNLSSMVDAMPNLSSQGLYGGLEYFDGQFDDSRLTITLAQSVADAGGVAINYAKVVGLVHEKNRLAGVVAQDMETGDQLTIRAKAVVNATGVFADSLRQMDDSDAKPVVTFSQGSHLVLDKKFLPGEKALMIPSTKDGRVIFAIPWHEMVLVGTTDLPIKESLLEPRPQRDEIDFMLSHLADYLECAPRDADIKSVFSGIRPLISGGEGSKTADLSRDHQVFVSKTGLVTVAGGKWTTYRQVSQDTVDRAVEVAGLEARACGTRSLRLHGWTATPERTFAGLYGSDEPALQEIERDNSVLGNEIHANLPYRGSEVVWAVRHEMARSVEDVLARRTRSLLLDAKASIEAASEVARLMAQEMGKDDHWVKQQVRDYTETAQGYLI